MSWIENSKQACLAKASVTEVPNVYWKVLPTAIGTLPPRHPGETSNPCPKQNPLSSPSFELRILLVIQVGTS